MVALTSKICGGQNLDGSRDEVADVKHDDESWHDGSSEETSGHLAIGSDGKISVIAILYQRKIRIKIKLKIRIKKKIRKIRKIFQKNLQKSSEKSSEKSELKIKLKN